MTFDFQAEFDRSWADMASRLGVMALFTPESGDPVEAWVFLQKNTQLQPAGGFQTWELGITIEYNLSDIPREAVPGETFTVEGVVYTVRSIESNNGFTVKAVVT